MTVSMVYCTAVMHATSPATVTLHPESGSLTLAGFHVARIVSAGIFREICRTEDVSSACHERWTDMIATLVGLSRPVEAYVVHGTGSPATSQDGPVITAGFLAAGRGPNAEASESDCRRAFRELWTIVSASLDYAEL